MLDEGGHDTSSNFDLFLWAIALHGIYKSIFFWSLFDGLTFRFLQVAQAVSDVKFFLSVLLEYTKSIASS